MHTETMFTLLIRAHKKLSSIGAWENSKKASLEAQLKQIEVIGDFSFCQRFFIFHFSFFPKQTKFNDHKFVNFILMSLQVCWGETIQLSS